MFAGVVEVIGVNTRTERAENSRNGHLANYSARNSSINLFSTFKKKSLTILMSGIAPFQKNPFFPLC